MRTYISACYLFVMSSGGDEYLSHARKPVRGMTFHTAKYKRRWGGNDVNSLGSDDKGFISGKIPYFLLTSTSSEWKTSIIEKIAHCRSDSPLHMIWVFTV